MANKIPANPHELRTHCAESVRLDAAQSETLPAREPIEQDPPAGIPTTPVSTPGLFPPSTPSTTFSPIYGRPLTPAENEILLLHYPLVRTVTLSVVARLPNHIDADDLRGAGLAGLIAAVKRFVPDRGGTFASYAAMKIRGAILDELRRMDSCPRRQRMHAREIKAAVGTVEQRTGRTATNAEVAAELGLTEARYAKRAARIERDTAGTVSLDFESEDHSPLHAVLIDESDVTGRDSMQSAERMEQLVARIAALPDRKRRIMAMRFVEGMKLSEIAAVLDLSESRIAQILDEIISTLRVFFHRTANS